jgi:hypothetical protein
MIQWKSARGRSPHSGAYLPEAAISQIVDRTDGVPLFVEKLIKPPAFSE